MENREDHEALRQEMPEKKESFIKKIPLKKIGRIAGIAAGAIAAVYLGICIVAAASHTVFGKTDVLGVDVSGMTKVQIQELWSEKGTQACRQATISLLLDENEAKRVALTDLGVTVTMKDAADGAWDSSHGGNFITNGARLIRSWFRETSVVPSLTVDSEKLNSGVQAVVQELSYSPIDGAYRLDEEKTDGFYVTKPANGIAVEENVLLQALQKDLEQRALAPITCRYQVLQAAAIDLDAVAEELSEPVNAGYNKETGGTTAERVGITFDVAAAKALLEQAQPGEEFAVSGQLVQPKVTEEQLKEVMFRDVLGSYTTHVGGTDARKTNVRLAAEKIDDCILNSGETFSYNTVVGQRTTARGFQAAPAYVGGKTVDEVGGGICQVSSTLYYATMLSNLEIVTREEHMYAPSYITFGCDATVSWGGPDYVFRNSSDYPIKIVTYYGDGNLTVKIYGTKVDDTYVRIVSETLSTTDYTVVYEKTDELAAGVEQVEQTPYTGYYVKTWRNIYSSDGTLLSSNVEATSDYSARNKIVKVGTKAVASTKTTPATKEETKTTEETGTTETTQTPETPVTPETNTNG